MTESPLEKHLAWITATHGSIDTMIETQQRAIDFVLSQASGLDKARERALQMAEANLGPSLEFKRQMLENAAVTANVTNNWEQIYNSVQMAANLSGVKWANSIPDTATLLASKMADISSIAGINLGTPRVDLLLQNARELSETETPEQRQKVEEFISSRPELEESIEQLGVLVDLSDPENRKLIVWGVKTLFCLGYALMITGFGDQAVAIAGLLSSMGVNPVQIANALGNKVDGALEKRFRPENEDDQNDDED